MVIKDRGICDAFKLQGNVKVQVIPKIVPWITPKRACSDSADT